MAREMLLSYLEALAVDCMSAEGRTMTVVVKRSEGDVISLPASMMADLNLQEGDDVMIVVNGKVVHIARAQDPSEVRAMFSDYEDLDDERL